MKKMKFRSISETDFLSDEQLDAVEMGSRKCEPSCKKGCLPSRHDGQSTVKEAKDLDSLQEHAKVMLQ